MPFFWFLPSGPAKLYILFLVDDVSYETDSSGRFVGLKDVTKWQLDPVDNTRELEDTVEEMLKLAVDGCNYLVYKSVEIQDKYPGVYCRAPQIAFVTLAR